MVVEFLKNQVWTTCYIDCPTQGNRTKDVAILKADPVFEPKEYSSCSASLKIPRLKESDTGLYYCKNGQSLKHFSVIALSICFFTLVLNPQLFFSFNITNLILNRTRGEYAWGRKNCLC